MSENPILIEVREARQRRYGRNGGQRLYRVHKTFSESEAVTAVFGGADPVAPTQWGDFKLADYEATEVPKAPGLWEVSATWGRPAVEIFPGTIQVSYDTTGATVNQLYATLPGVTYPSTFTASLGGAIGLAQDGSITGVERPVGRLAIEIRTKLTSSQVTDAYAATLFSATGKINVSAYRGFKPQELLFMGARLNQQNALEWDASYVFQAEYERTNFTIGSVTGITKKGWQYLWTYFGEAVATVGTGLTQKQITVKNAEIVRCEDIYETTNFNALAIPGASNNSGGLFPAIAMM